MRLHEGRAFLPASIAGTYWRNNRDFRVIGRSDLQWLRSSRTLWPQQGLWVLFQVGGKGTGRCRAERKGSFWQSAQALVQNRRQEREGRSRRELLPPPRHEVLLGLGPLCSDDWENTEFWTHLDGLNEGCEKKRGIKDISFHGPDNWVGVWFHETGTTEGGIDFKEGVGITRDIC